MARKIRNAAINVALLAVGAIAGLALCEAGLRVFNPVEMRIKGDEINLGYNTRVEIPAIGQRKFDPLIIHSRNAIGFRGPNPPNDFENSLTILVVGGSTTEGFYLSDGNTWPEQLGHALDLWFDGVWVNNAGLDGHSSFGHIFLMRQHVVRLKPKVVLFLVGINEVAKADASNYDDYIRPKSPLAPRAGRARILYWLSRHSELYALYLNLRRSWTAAKGQLNHSELDFQGMVPRVYDVDPDAEAQELARHDTFLPGFEDRLVTLIGISRKHGINPVFVTQPAVYGQGTDPQTNLDLARMPFKPPRQNGRVAWHILERYNDVTRRVAAGNGVPLIDLARRMPKDTRYYYDRVHFTNEGAAKVADIVASDLCPYLRKTYPNYSGGSCPQPRP